jgi:hypothetical protein
MTQSPESFVPNVQDPEFLAAKTLPELHDILHRVDQSITNLAEYRRSICDEISRKDAPE